LLVYNQKNEIRTQIIADTRRKFFLKLLNTFHLTSVLIPLFITHRVKLQKYHFLNYIIYITIAF